LPSRLRMQARVPGPRHSVDGVSTFVEQLCGGMPPPRATDFPRECLDVDRFLRSSLQTLADTGVLSSPKALKWAQLQQLCRGGDALRDDTPAAPVAAAASKSGRRVTVGGAASALEAAGGGGGGERLPTIAPRASSRKSSASALRESPLLVKASARRSVGALPRGNCRDVAAAAAAAAAAPTLPSSGRVDLSPLRATVRRVSEMYVRPEQRRHSQLPLQSEDSGRGDVASVEQWAKATSALPSDEVFRYRRY
jgi:hypothetical protein